MFGRNCFRALVLICVVLPFAGCVNTQVGSITVTPATQSLTVGQTAQFTATGVIGHGSHPTSSQDVTSQATWTSSAPAIATVSSSGLATAVSAGTATITASMAGSTSGTATLTVTPSTGGSTGEPLVSMVIVPGTQTLTAVNQTAGLIAIGTTSSGATVDLTNMPATIGSATIKAATWSSSVTSVATINASTGVATALANGTSAITAVAFNPDGTVVSATATLTVNLPTVAEPLVSLAIVPGSQAASVVGQTAQFIAIGTTSSGTTVNLTNQPATIGGVTVAAAAWGSSSSAVATINPATGLATAVSSGVVAVTALAKNPDGTVVTGTATFTVAAKPEPLVSLSIVPATQTLTAAGQPAQFIAIGTTASGATVNLTNTAATIGAATIAAATWSSSSGAVATINPISGLATAGTSGTTVITAIATNPDGTAVTGTATLTVNIPGSPEPLVSLVIVPASQQALAANQTAQFIAIGTTSSGTTVNLTNQTATIGSSTIAAASWTSSNPAVATVNAATGVATALSAGSAAITAIATNPDGTVVTGTAAYTVTIPSGTEPLVSMAIVPASQTLTLIGQTAQLVAIATTGTGTTVNLTNQGATIGSATILPAVWSSSAPGVASVNPGTGVVTALTAGTTVITAIASNPDKTVVTGVSTITVTATGGAGGTVASIAVIPGAQAVQSPNATAQFMAIGTTTTGATVDLTNQVAWSSSSAQICTIGAATGLATGVGQGTATITAIAPTGNNTVVTGTATFTVIGGTTEAITALAITPNTQSLSISQSGQFIALGTTGTAGVQQDVTSSPSITWSSSIPSIATVSSTGLATGVSAGQTTITAEWTNKDNSVASATATLTISSTPAPEPLLSLAIIPAGTVTVLNLQDTANFLAIGTYSTAPNVRDLTSSVTWISSSPNVFPVSTNSTPPNPGSPGGIVTAYGSGGATIIAEATDPTTGSIQTATATFSCPLVIPNLPVTPGSCYPGSQASALLATITVYNEGLNTTNWEVTAPSATGTPNVIHCGPGWTLNGGTGGSVCVGTYPVGATITLTATQPAGVTGTFGGWSSSCTTTSPNPSSTAGPNTCTIVPNQPPYTDANPVPTNITVGAIFN